MAVDFNSFRNRVKAIDKEKEEREKLLDSGYVNPLDLVKEASDWNSNYKDALTTKTKTIFTEDAYKHEVDDKGRSRRVRDEEGNYVIEDPTKTREVTQSIDFGMLRDLGFSDEDLRKMNYRNTQVNDIKKQIEKQQEKNVELDKAAREEATSTLMASVGLAPNGYQVFSTNDFVTKTAFHSDPQKVDKYGDFFHYENNIYTDAYANRRLGEIDNNLQLLNDTLDLYYQWYDDKSGTTYDPTTNTYVANRYLYSPKQLKEMIKNVETQIGKLESEKDELQAYSESGHAQREGYTSLDAYKEKLSEKQKEEETNTQARKDEIAYYTYIVQNGLADMDKVNELFNKMQASREEAQIYAIDDPVKTAKEQGLSADEVMALAKEWRDKANQIPELAGMGALDSAAASKAQDEFNVRALALEQYAMSLLPQKDIQTQYDELGDTIELYQGILDQAEDIFKSQQFSGYAVADVLLESEEDAYLDYLAYNLFGSREAALNAIRELQAVDDDPYINKSQEQIILENQVDSWTRSYLKKKISDTEDERNSVGNEIARRTLSDFEQKIKYSKDENLVKAYTDYMKFLDGSLTTIVEDGEAHYATETAYGKRLHQALLDAGYSAKEADDIVEYNHRAYTEVKRLARDEKVEWFVRDTFGTGISTIASVATSLMSGLGIFEALRMRDHQGHYTQIDVNSSFLVPQQITKNIRNTVQEIGNIPGFNDSIDFFDLGYGILTSSLDSMAAAYLGMGIGTVAGAAGIAAAGTVGSIVSGYTLGASAAVEKMVDMTERGASTSEAFLGGLIAGAFEAIFESVSISQFEFMNEIENVTGWKDALTNMGKSFLTNFSEEALTEAANTIYDFTANWKYSDFKVSYDQYYQDYLESIADPLASDIQVHRAAEAYAKKMVSKDATNNILKSGLTGGLQGILMGITAILKTKAQENNRFQKVNPIISTSKNDMRKMSYTDLLSHYRESVAAYNSISLYLNELAENGNLSQRQADMLSKAEAHMKEAAYQLNGRDIHAIVDRQATVSQDGDYKTISYTDANDKLGSMRYNGSTVDNMPNGEGIAWSQNGTIYTGIWENGKLVSGVIFLEDGQYRLVTRNEKGQIVKSPAMPLRPDSNVFIFTGENASTSENVKLFQDQEKVEKLAEIVGKLAESLLSDDERASLESERAKIAAELDRQKNFGYVLSTYHWADVYTDPTKATLASLRYDILSMIAQDPARKRPAKATAPVNTEATVDTTPPAPESSPVSEPQQASDIPASESGTPSNDSPYPFVDFENMSLEELQAEYTRLNKEYIKKYAHMSKDEQQDAQRRLDRYKARIAELGKAQGEAAPVASPPPPAQPTQPSPAPASAQPEAPAPAQPTQSPAPATNVTALPLNELEALANKIIMTDLSRFELKGNETIEQLQSMREELRNIPLGIGQEAAASEAAGLITHEQRMNLVNMTMPYARQATDLANAIYTALLKAGSGSSDQNAQSAEPETPQAKPTAENNPNSRDAQAQKAYKEFMDMSDSKQDQLRRAYYRNKNAFMQLEVGDVLINDKARDENSRVIGTVTAVDDFGVQVTTNTGKLNIWFEHNWPTGSKLYDIGFVDLWFDYQYGFNSHSRGQEMAHFERADGTRIENTEKAVADYMQSRPLGEFVNPFDDLEPGKPASTNQPGAEQAAKPAQEEPAPQPPSPVDVLIGAAPNPASAAENVVSTPAAESHAEPIASETPTAPEQTKTEPKRTSLNPGVRTTITLKGVTMEGRQEILNSMQSGDPVTFTAEPGAGNDPHAVAVRNANNQIIGWIPKANPQQNAIFDAVSNHVGQFNVELTVRHGTEGKNTGADVTFVYNAASAQQTAPAASAQPVDESLANNESAAKTPAQKAQNTQNKKTKEIPQNVKVTFPLAGMSRIKSQNLLAAMSPGDTVTFAAEDYKDMTLLAVRNSDNKTLGYIARSNSLYRPMLNAVENNIGTFQASIGSKPTEITFIYQKEATAHETSGTRSGMGEEDRGGSETGSELSGHPGGHVLSGTDRARPEEGTVVPGENRSGAPDNETSGSGAQIGAALRPGESAADLGNDQQAQVSKAAGRLIEQSKIIRSLVADWRISVYDRGKIKSIDEVDFANQLKGTKEGNQLLDDINYLTSAGVPIVLASSDLMSKNVGFKGFCRASKRDGTIGIVIDESLLTSDVEKFHNILRHEVGHYVMFVSDRFNNFLLERWDSIFKFGSSLSSSKTFIDSLSGKEVDVDNVDDLIVILARHAGCDIQSVDEYKALDDQDKIAVIGEAIANCADYYKRGDPFFAEAFNNPEELIQEYEACLAILMSSVQRQREAKQPGDVFTAVDRAVEKRKASSPVGVMQTFDFSTGYESNPYATLNFLEEIEKIYTGYTDDQGTKHLGVVEAIAAVNNGKMKMAQFEEMFGRYGWKWTPVGPQFNSNLIEFLPAGFLPFDEENALIKRTMSAEVKDGLALNVKELANYLRMNGREHDMPSVVGMQVMPGLGIGMRAIQGARDKYGQNTFSNVLIPEHYFENGLSEYKNPLTKQLPKTFGDWQANIALQVLSEYFSQLTDKEGETAPSVFAMNYDAAANNVLKCANQDALMSLMLAAQKNEPLYVWDNTTRSVKRIVLYRDGQPTLKSINFNDIVLGQLYRYAFGYDAGADEAFIVDEAEFDKFRNLQSAIKEQNYELSDLEPIVNYLIETGDEELSKLTFTGDQKDTEHLVGDEALRSLVERRGAAILDEIRQEMYGEPDDNTDISEYEDAYDEESGAEVGNATDRGYVSDRGAEDTYVSFETAYEDAKREVRRLENEKKKYKRVVATAEKKISLAQAAFDQAEQRSIEPSYYRDTDGYQQSLRIVDDKAKNLQEAKDYLADVKRLAEPIDKRLQEARNLVKAVKKYKSQPSSDSALRAALNEFLGIKSDDAAAGNLDYTDTHGDTASMSVEVKNVKPIFARLDASDTDNHAHPFLTLKELQNFFVRKRNVASSDFLASVDFTRLFWSGDQYGRKTKTVENSQNNLNNQTKGQIIRDAFNSKLHESGKYFTVDSTLADTVAAAMLAFNQQSEDKVYDFERDFGSLEIVTQPVYDALKNLESISDLQRMFASDMRFHDLDVEKSARIVDGILQTDVDFSDQEIRDSYTEAFKELGALDGYHALHAYEYYLKVSALRSAVRDSLAKMTTEEVRERYSQVKNSDLSPSEKKRALFRDQLAQLDNLYFNARNEFLREFNKKQAYYLTKTDVDRITGNIPINQPDLAEYLAEDEIEYVTRVWDDEAMKNIPKEDRPYQTIAMALNFSVQNIERRMEERQKASDKIKSLNDTLAKSFLSADERAALNRELARAKAALARADARIAANKTRMDVIRRGQDAELEALMTIPVPLAEPDVDAGEVSTYSFRPDRTIVDPNGNVYFYTHANIARGSRFNPKKVSANSTISEQLYPHDNYGVDPGMMRLGNDAFWKDAFIGRFRRIANDKIPNISAPDESRLWGTAIAEDPASHDAFDSRGNLRTKKVYVGASENRQLLYAQREKLVQQETLRLVHDFIQKAQNVADQVLRSAPTVSQVAGLAYDVTKEAAERLGIGDAVTLTIRYDPNTHMNLISVHDKYGSHIGYISPKDAKFSEYMNAMRGGSNVVGYISQLIRSDEKNPAKIDSLALTLVVETPNIADENVDIFKTSLEDLEKMPGVLTLLAKKGHDIENLSYWQHRYEVGFGVASMALWSKVKNQVFDRDTDKWETSHYWNRSAYASDEDFGNALFEAGVLQPGTGVGMSVNDVRNYIKALNSGAYAFADDVWFIDSYGNKTTSIKNVIADKKGELGSVYDMIPGLDEFEIVVGTPVNTVFSDHFEIRAYDTEDGTKVRQIIVSKDVSPTDRINELTLALNVLGAFQTADGSFETFADPIRFYGKQAQKKTNPSGATTKDQVIACLGKGLKTLREAQANGTLNDLIANSVFRADGTKKSSDIPNANQAAQAFLKNAQNGNLDLYLAFSILGAQEKATLESWQYNGEYIFGNNDGKRRDGTDYHRSALRDTYKAYAEETSGNPNARPRYKYDGTYESLAAIYANKGFKISPDPMVAAAQVKDWAQKILLSDKVISRLNPYGMTLDMVLDAIDGQTDSNMLTQEVFERLYKGEQIEGLQVWTTDYGSDYKRQLDDWYTRKRLYGELAAGEMPTPSDAYQSYKDKLQAWIDGGKQGRKPSFRELVSIEGTADEQFVKALLNTMAPQFANQKQTAAHALIDQYLQEEDYKALARVFRASFADYESFKQIYSGNERLAENYTPFDGYKNAYFAFGIKSPFELVGRRLADAADSISKITGIAYTVTDLIDALRETGYESTSYPYRPAEYQHNRPEPPFSVSYYAKQLGNLDDNARALAAKFNKPFETAYFECASYDLNGLQREIRRWDAYVEAQKKPDLKEKAIAKRQQLLDLLEQFEKACQKYTIKQQTSSEVPDFFSSFHIIEDPVEFVRTMHRDDENIDEAIDNALQYNERQLAKAETVLRGLLQYSEANRVAPDAKQLDALAEVKKRTGKDPEGLQSLTASYSNEQIAQFQDAVLKIESAVIRARRNADVYLDRATLRYDNVSSEEALAAARRNDLVVQAEEVFGSVEGLNNFIEVVQKQEAMYAQDIFSTFQNCCESVSLPTPLFSIRLTDAALTDDAVNNYMQELLHSLDGTAESRASSSEALFNIFRDGTPKSDLDQAVIDLAASTGYLTALQDKVMLLDYFREDHKIYTDFYKTSVTESNINNKSYVGTQKSYRDLAESAWGILSEYFKDTHYADNPIALINAIEQFNSTGTTGIDVTKMPEQIQHAYFAYAFATEHTVAPAVPAGDAGANPGFRSAINHVLIKSVVYEPLTGCSDNELLGLFALSLIDIRSNATASVNEYRGSKRVLSLAERAERFRLKIYEAADETEAKVITDALGKFCDENHIDYSDPDADLKFSIDGERVDPNGFIRSVFLKGKEIKKAREKAEKIYGFIDIVGSNNAAEGSAIRSAFVATLQAYENGAFQPLDLKNGEFGTDADIDKAFDEWEDNIYNLTDNTKTAQLRAQGGTLSQTELLSYIIHHQFDFADQHEVRQAICELLMERIDALNVAVGKKNSSDLITAVNAIRTNLSATREQIIEAAFIYNEALSFAMASNNKDMLWVDGGMGYLQVAEAAKEWLRQNQQNNYVTAQLADMDAHETSDYHVSCLKDKVHGMAMHLLSENERIKLGIRSLDEICRDDFDIWNAAKLTGDMSKFDKRMKDKAKFGFTAKEIDLMRAYIRNGSGVQLRKMNERIYYLGLTEEDFIHYRDLINQGDSHEIEREFDKMMKKAGHSIRGIWTGSKRFHADMQNWRYGAMLSQLTTHGNNVASTMANYASINAADFFIYKAEQKAIQNGEMTQAEATTAPVSKKSDALLFDLAEGEFEQAKRMLYSNSRLGSRAGSAYQKTGAIWQKADFSRWALEMEDHVMGKTFYKQFYASVLKARGIVTQSAFDALTDSEKASIQAIAVEKTQEALFRNFSLLAKIFVEANNTRIGKALIQPVAPFLKIAGNIMTQALKMSPFGYLAWVYDITMESVAKHVIQNNHVLSNDKLIKFIQKAALRTVGEFGELTLYEGNSRSEQTKNTLLGLIDGSSNASIRKSRRIKDFIMPSTGMLMVLLGMFGRACGLISTGDDPDDKIKTFMDYKEYKGYSLNIGKLQLPMSRIFPAGFGILFGAKLFDIFSRNQTRGSLVDTLADNTFIGDFFGMFDKLAQACDGAHEASEGKGVWAGIQAYTTEIFMTFANSYANQHIPGITKTIEGFLEKEEDQFFYDKDFQIAGIPIGYNIQNFLSNFTEGNPLLPDVFRSSKRDMLAQKKEKKFGEEVGKYMLRIALGNYAIMKELPYEDWYLPFAEMKDANGNPYSSQIMMEPVEKSHRVDNVRLTAEEYEIYNDALAAVRENILNALSADAQFQALLQLDKPEEERDREKLDLAARTVANAIYTANIAAGEKVREYRGTSEKKPEYTGNAYIGQGNIDLHNLPMIADENGDWMTMYTYTIQDKDGQWVNIPGIVDVDGAPTKVNEADAIRYYEENDKHLGKFATKEQAEAAASALMTEQQTFYKPSESDLAALINMSTQTKDFIEYIKLKSATAGFDSDNYTIDYDYLEQSMERLQKGELNPLVVNAIMKDPDFATLYEAYESDVDLEELYNLKETYNKAMSSDESQSLDALENMIPGLDSKTLDYFAKHQDTSFSKILDLYETDDQGNLIPKYNLNAWNDAKNALNSLFAKGSDDAQTATPEEIANYDRIRASAEVNGYGDMIDLLVSQYDRKKLGQANSDGYSTADYFKAYEGYHAINMEEDLKGSEKRDKFTTYLRSVFSNEKDVKYFANLLTYHTGITVGETQKDSFTNFGFNDKAATKAVNILKDLKPINGFKNVRECQQVIALDNAYKNHELDLGWTPGSWEGFMYNYMASIYDDGEEAFRAGFKTYEDGLAYYQDSMNDLSSSWKLVNYGFDSDVSVKACGILAGLKPDSSHTSVRNCQRVVALFEAFSNGDLKQSDWADHLYTYMMACYGGTDENFKKKYPNFKSAIDYYYGLL